MSAQPNCRDAIQLHVCLAGWVVRLVVPVAPPRLFTYTDLPCLCHRFLEFGALHRTIKQGALAASPRPVSCYIRVKSRWVVAMLPRVHCPSEK